MIHLRQKHPGPPLPPQPSLHDLDAVCDFHNALMTFCLGCGQQPWCIFPQRRIGTLHKRLRTHWTSGWCPIQCLRLATWMKLLMTIQQLWWLMLTSLVSTVSMLRSLSTITMNTVQKTQILALIAYWEHLQIRDCLIRTSRLHHTIIHSAILWPQQW